MMPASFTLLWSHASFNFSKIIVIIIKKIKRRRKRSNEVINFEDVNNMFAAPVTSAAYSLNVVCVCVCVCGVCVYVVYVCVCV